MSRETNGDKSQPPARFWRRENRPEWVEIQDRINGLELEMSELREQRNEAILQALETGASIRSLAADLGVTRQAVMKMIESARNSRNESGG